MSRPRPRVTPPRRRVRATLAVLGVLLLSPGPGAGAQDLWRTPEGRERVLDALVTVFREHYWDAERIDWSGWSSRYRDAALRAGSRPALDSVFRRMVEEIDDHHSSWIGLTLRPDEGLEIATRPRFGFRGGFVPGVGVVLERVYPTTPAAEAGLRRGDVMEGIAGRDLRGLEHDHQATAALAEAARAGAAEAAVRRGRERFRVRLEPARLDEDGLSTLVQGELLDEDLGYLFLPSFRSEGVAEAAHRELARLVAAGAEALVLDLRGNQGGRLGELGLVLGAFVEGPWARAISRGEVVWEGRYEAAGGIGASVLLRPSGRELLRRELAAPVRFDGPVAVLVDARSSSAGEIAALALQDLGRALVVGEPTAGNVEVVQGFDLPDGSLVMVAVANLEGAAGRSFAAGVRPDVVARSELAELARGYDAPLAEARRLLKGLPFTPSRFF